MSIIFAITFITLVIVHILSRGWKQTKRRKLPKLIKLEPRSEPYPRIMAEQDSALLILPPEVLTIVVSHLDWQGLLQARATCSTLKEFTDPVIFENFEIHHGQESEQLDILIEADPRRSNWLKSILVSTRFDEDDGLDCLPYHLSQMSNLRQLILETPDCNNKQPSERTSWILLQQAYEAIFEHSTLAIPRERRMLPLLEKCTMHFVDESVSLYPLTKYESIFLHPTLKSLTLSCACTDEPHQILAEHRQYMGKTALEHLHLEECDFNAQSLEILLGFPKALKSLVMSEGTRYNDDFGAKHSRMHGDLYPPRLTEALKSVAHSLKHLSLSLGHTRRHSLTDSRGLHLSSLTKLVDLDISYRSWRLVASISACKHDWSARLPSSLERIRVFQIPIFKLRGHHALLFRQCLFLDKAGHGLPNLKTLQYSYHYTVPHGRTGGFPFLPDQLTGGLAMEKLIDKSVDRIKGTHDRRYPLYARTGIHVMVECEMTPPGYIPPYLNNEEKPQYRIVWDSKDPTPQSLVASNDNPDPTRQGSDEPVDYDNEPHVDAGGSWIMSALEDAPANAPGFFELLLMHSGQPVVDPF